jgi:hypothetical protein
MKNVAYYQLAKKLLCSSALVLFFPFHFDTLLNLTGKVNASINIDQPKLAQKVLLRSNWQIL